MPIGSLDGYSRFPYGGLMFVLLTLDPCSPVTEPACVQPVDSEDSGGNPLLPGLPRLPDIPGAIAGHRFLFSFLMVRHGKLGVAAETYQQRPLARVGRVGAVLPFGGTDVGAVFQFGAAPVSVLGT